MRLIREDRGYRRYENDGDIVEVRAEIATEIACIAQVISEKIAPQVAQALYVVVDEKIAALGGEAYGSYFVEASAPIASEHGPLVRVTVDRGYWPPAPVAGTDAYTAAKVVA